MSFLLRTLLSLLVIAVLYCISLTLWEFYIGHALETNSIRKITEKQGNDKTLTSDSFAIVTYCSCDKLGCPVYEYTNRLKDLYCQIHGCTHLIYNFIPRSPGGKFRETNSSETNVKAMWALIDALIETMEDKRSFEWVMLTGGDQTIVNLDLAPAQIVPRQGLSRYDIIFPVSTKIHRYGLMSPPMLRNNAYMRRFVRRWADYASKGNYLVEDQSAMNVEVVRMMMDQSNASSREIRAMLRSFLRMPQSPCYLKVIVPTYDLVNGEAGKRYFNRHSRISSKCILSYFKKYYGTPPYRSSNPGRRNTSILVYQTFSANMSCESGDGECGYDWNCRGKKTSNCWMMHANGRQKQLEMKRALDSVKKEYRLKLSKPSSVFQKCVKKSSWLKTWRST